MMPKMMERVDIMEMMPKMMMGMMGRGEGEGGMMSKMMEGCGGKETTMMSQMMMEDMMPKCLEMMLPNIPKEKRVNFVMKMAKILIEQGCVGMSDEEKKDLVTKIGQF